MKLTKEQSYDMTIGFYKWAAKHPKKNKLDYPKVDLSQFPGQCPCCEYAGYKLNNPDIGDCRKCPIAWPVNVAGDRVCDGHDGLWFLWKMADTPKERKKYATMISELPMRE